ncbi:hypothetical protein ELE36_00095 (plasmid) [Pseudolysobacter antarcticus]|uniref:Uncharacterized protein n=1 Tax=Pseudolysobacter antarcticus TaxID=2511995 RepID=A0A411HEI8_9GAMM|nr:hypothetical protein [Pseudolysobacter antarcticus]QBB68902.1 hypothetical protein ELE36_00095 [Pseudolysobacter antarcticus]
MLAAILGALSAIVLGIAGNLLTPYVREFLRLPPEKEAPPLPTPSTTPQEPEDIEAIRARNRAQLHALVWQAYLYGVSFFFIYMAIYLPLSFAAPINGQLDLSHTRIRLDWIFAQENFATLAALFAVSLFAPLWLLAQTIAQGVAVIGRKFYYIGPYRFGAFATLSVALLSLVLAGHVIYLIYPNKSYTDSVLLPFIVFVGVGAFAASRK